MTGPEKSGTVNGMRILMVEDEMMLAMSLEDQLDALHCRVVMAGNVKRALNLVETEDVDGALLDINIGGDDVYPVAHALNERNVPFAFMTGYSESSIDAAWQNRPVLCKPFTQKHLERTMATTFGS